MLLLSGFFVLVSLMGSKKLQQNCIFFLSAMESCSKFDFSNVIIKTIRWHNRSIIWTNLHSLEGIHQGKQYLNRGTCKTKCVLSNYVIYLILQRSCPWCAASLKKMPYWTRPERHWASWNLSVWSTLRKQIHKNLTIF